MFKNPYKPASSTRQFELNCLYVVEPVQLEPFFFFPTFGIILKMKKQNKKQKQPTYKRFK